MPDDPTITEFVQRDYARVVNAVAFATGNDATAEDLVQEALARAWARIDRGLTIESLPNWVVAVALNLSKSRWRRVALERKVLDRMERPAPTPSPSGDPVDVARALASLPRRQREVAVLRYLLGMPTRDVADALGVSEGTVKNSLSKAREALAAQLAVTDEEVPSDVEDR